MIISDFAVHGHFDDLMEIIDHNGSPSKVKPYIFTGNIINYGPNSIYCLTMIMLWTISIPESVFCIRGNHEHASYSLKFGFVHEICSVYAPSSKNQSTLQKLFISLHELFRCLPLCVQLYKKCLICHGGLWRDVHIDLETVRHIQRNKEENIGHTFREIGVALDLIEMTDEKRTHFIVQDILWSSFSNFVSSISFNEIRGISVSYGRQHVKNVLQKNNLRTLIISGRPLKHGYKSFGVGCIQCVFSASSYFGKNSNLGGYLLVEENDLQIHPCSFSVERGKRDKHYHYRKLLDNGHNTTPKY